MRKYGMMGVVCFLGALVFGDTVLADVRIAGVLELNLDAAALSGNEGDFVSSWGSFTNVVTAAGPTLKTNYFGVKSVYFDGTGSSVLSAVLPSAQITKTTTAFSLEAWVCAPALTNTIGCYFAGTRYITSIEKKTMAFRYDTSNAALDVRPIVISFGEQPATNRWHHIAVTRNAIGVITVYLNGSYSGSRARGDHPGFDGSSPYSLGGILREDYSAYTNFFKGAIARLRVHTETLSANDVRYNYLSEVETYTAGQRAVWTGAANVEGAWNDAANWGGVATTVGAYASITQGLVAVTNNITGSGPVNQIRMDAGRLEFRLPDPGWGILSVYSMYLGRKAGDQVEWNLRTGTSSSMSTQTKYNLVMGHDNAQATLRMGGGSLSAQLTVTYASVMGTNVVWALGNRAYVDVGQVRVDPNGAMGLSMDGATVRARSLNYVPLFWNQPQIGLGTNGVTIDVDSGRVSYVTSTLKGLSSAGSGVVKTGVGTLVLSGTNSYGGATRVMQGSLVLASRLTSGLIFRLDGSATNTMTFAADGSNIVAWADANGSGLVFTPTNLTINPPAYMASLYGGRGGVRFSQDGSVSKRLVANRVTRIQSVFAVLTPASGNNNGGFLGLSGNDNGVRLSGSAFTLAGNDNDFLSWGGEGYVNGLFTNVFTVGATTVMSAIGQSYYDWTVAIGDYCPGYKRIYRGDVAEILAYNRAIDDLERLEIEAYLKAKWQGIGTVAVVSERVLPAQTELAVDDGASLDLGGTSISATRLTGTGMIFNRLSRPSVMEINAEQSYPFGGAISGAVQIVKTGAGALTLAGRYPCGDVSVEAGALRLISSIDTVPGLAYCLDASNPSSLVITGGVYVTQWNDANGGPISFVSTNETLLCPTYDATLFNGRGGVRFGASGSRRRMIATATTNAQTIFVVTAPVDVTSDNAGVWGRNMEDKGLRISGNGWRTVGTDANDFTHGSSDYYVNGLRTNVFTAGRGHLFSGVSTAPWTLLAAIGDYWFSSQYTGRYYRGDIAEIRVYDRALRSEERQAIEAYLMAKWFQRTSGGMSMFFADQTLRVADGASVDLAGGSQQCRAVEGAGVITNGTLVVTQSVMPQGVLQLPAQTQLSGTLALRVFSDNRCDQLITAGALSLTNLVLQLELPQNPGKLPYTLVQAAALEGPFKEAQVASPWSLYYTGTEVRLIYTVGTILLVR